MTLQYLMYEEVEVSVSGFFTTHHWFEAESGTVAKLLFPAFAGRAVLTIGDSRECLIQKIGWLSSGHEFLDGNVVRGVGDKVGLLSQDNRIEFDGEQYLLQAEGLFSQSRTLLDQAGTKLLEIQPRGAFKQGSYVTASAIVSVELAAFAYYIVHVRQQESTAAVAATAN